MPRNSAIARDTSTIDGASSRPNTSPSRSRRTLIALSTMSCDGLRKRFSTDGETVGRMSGASTGVPETRRTVTVPVWLK